MAIKWVEPPPIPMASLVVPQMLNTDAEPIPSPCARALERLVLETANTFRFQLRKHLPGTKFCSTT
jgi:hypothetical protein